MTKNEGESLNQNLHVLRGVAIIFVLIDHIFEFVPQLGSLGVAIFFVISGFLMFDLNRMKSGALDGGEFIKARFIRIYPMLIFSTLFTILLVLVGLIGKESVKRIDYFESIPFIVLGIPNFFGLMPWNSPDLPPGFIPLWSVGVEIQFYLIIACLIYFGKLNIKSTWFIISLIIVGLISHVLVLIITEDMSFWTMPFTYLSLFSFGIWVSMKEIRFPHKANVINQHVLLIGILFTLIFLLWMEFNSLEDYYGLGYTIFELLAMAIFYVGIRFGVGHLNNRFMSWISSRSYSLYLMHFPVRTLVIENFSVTDTNVFVNLLIFSLSLAIAEITYRFVEVRFWTPKYSGNTMVSSFFKGNKRV